VLKLAADEDVNDDVVRGLWRREPALDLVRVCCGVVAPVRGGARG
jgi:hypothetical protein